MSTGTLHDELTLDEQQVFGQAVEAGYLIASGQRLQVLRAWRAYCRRERKRCVVIRFGQRSSSVNIDGAGVWKGKTLDQAETEARRHAEPLVSGLF